MNSLPLPLVIDCRTIVSQAYYNTVSSISDIDANQMSLINIIEKFTAHIIKKRTWKYVQVMVGGDNAE